MNFYSMKNKFVDTFNQPFAVENDKAAIYTVRQMINAHQDPKIIAEDFGLFRVGTFDPVKGVFDSLKKPVELVADCSALVRKELQNEE